MRDRLTAACVIFALAVLLPAGLPVFVPLSRAARADEVTNDAEKDEAKALKERITAWARTYSEGSKVKISAKSENGANEEQPADLVPNPVLRYSDEERGIPDATLWVWTRDARPVALQKVEAV